MNVEAYKYISRACRIYHKDRGWMCLVAIRDGKIKEKWFTPRDMLAALVEWGDTMNEDGWNVFMSWALHTDKDRKQAKLCGAYVADWDDMSKRRVIATPTLTVQTSKGRCQDIYIHEPRPRDECSTIYRAMTRQLGGVDQGPSNDAGHLWRLPGLWNWPNAKKKAAGRVKEKSSLRGKLNGALDLSSLMPKSEIEVDSGGDDGEWPERRTGGILGKWFAAMLKEDGDDASAHFHKVVVGAAEKGWGWGNIVGMLRGKTCVPPRYEGRLEREVRRCIARAIEEGNERMAKVLARREEVKERIDERTSRARVYNHQDEARPLSFIWDPYLPRGEYTSLDGDGGVGKTTMLLGIAMAVMRGSKMVNGAVLKAGGSVLYVSTEADYEGDTLPVLQAMGARFGDHFAHLEAPGFVLDEEGIDELVFEAEYRKLDLIIIDSVADYLPDQTDMNKYQDVKKFLSLLISKLARPHDLAVVGIRHNGKGAKDKLSQRGMGSMAWHSGARSQLVTREDPDVEDQFICVHTKSNRVRRGKPFIYAIKTQAGRGVIDWVGMSEVSEEQMNEKPNADRHRIGQECQAWLDDFLKGKADGVEVSLINTAGEAKGFSKQQIYRASVSLDVVRSDITNTRNGRIAFWKSRVIIRSSSTHQ